MSQTSGIDAIKPEQAETLHGLFVERVRRHPERVAYQYFDEASAQWCETTWRGMAREVARWQAAMLGEGLQPGDRVCIMVRNCPQWVMYDQAALSLGLVLVPLYTSDRPDNVAYIVEDSGARLFLYDTPEQWSELRQVAGRMPSIQRFISLKGGVASDDPRCIDADDWLPREAELRQEVSGQQLATIMYTSGTTGKPKGVMLSNSNILHNAYDALEAFPVCLDDQMLSFLPLSHAFERTVGYYLAMMAGCRVAYARSISTLSDDMQRFRPSILISVPRIYERIHTAMQDRLAADLAYKRKLFEWAVDVGWSRFEYRQGRATWQPRLLLWPLLKRLVADKLMARLGGNLRLAASGGAALPGEISRVFIALGVNLLQGYGLTETSPIVGANRSGNNFPSSVGQPLPEVEVRVDQQGALLVRGPNVMMGYWNNPVATRETIDHDGWLNTGDIAHISETGHIYITGRLKEVIVLSNGEKVPPADMEYAILRDRLFMQAMLYGEGRPFLVALVVVDPDRWRQFAAEVGVHADMPESLHDARVEQKVLARIAEQIREFPGYAKIRRVLLLTRPWTIEGGQLTPKLSLRRNRVEAEFVREIERLYERH